MKGIYTTHTIIGERISQLDTLCHQVKLPVPEVSYIWLHYWPKKPHGNPHAPQIIDFSSQHNGVA